MDAFWSTTMGHMVIGAIAGGLGAAILPILTRPLPISDGARGRISNYGAIVLAVLAVNISSNLERPADEAVATVAHYEAQKFDKALTEAKASGESGSAAKFAEKTRVDANDAFSTAQGDKKAGARCKQLSRFLSSEHSYESGFLRIDGCADTTLRF